MKYGSDNLLARRSNKGVSADARIEQRQYLTTPGLNPSVTSVSSVAKIITVLTRGKEISAFCHLTSDLWLLTSDLV